MILLSSASTPPLEFLSEAETSPHISAMLSRATSHYTEWMITDWHDSPSAILFLVEHETSGERRVIKMLRSYQDTRYSLETLEKRQQSLLEGLERNRVFTPELYLGLAPVRHLDVAQGTICIGEAIEYPTQKLPDRDTEYVLLMQPQEQESRLDYLLNKEEALFALNGHDHKSRNEPVDKFLRKNNAHFERYVGGIFNN